jgi:AAA+ ATPase superfamily predicted ATPase
MKFYNRQTELNDLAALCRQSKKQGKMVILTGRRRVGKTMLALEFAKNHKFIYLFVSKKTEELLCQEFIAEIKSNFDTPVIGEIRHFKDILKLLLEISVKHNFTLIIDEFQEFYNINPAVFSEVQNLWDAYKHKSKINLIFIGSVYSLMYKIFMNAKEPLFNRADRVFSIKPFTIQNAALILKDYNNFSLKNLFNYYVFTGCMPRYIDTLVSNDIFSLNGIIDFALSSNSPFLNEGKNILIEEFGKEYNTYFSILSLIASGKTARPEIESILERNIGGYLDRLEKDFGIIEKYKPFDAKQGSRLQKYRIVDNFLIFWFRFIYSNWSAIETENFDYVKQIIRRDYDTYSGRMLEKFFRELILSSGKYNVVGSYWDRKGENEIDIVAINEIKKNILFAEVKLNKSKISIAKLKEKSQKLLDSYKHFKVELKPLSLEDADEYLA